MKTKTLTFTAKILSATLVFCAHSFAASDADIALQFFPATFKATILSENQESAVDLSKYVNFSRADLDGTGKSTYLVCVYSDRANGALKVINTAGASPVLAAEASQVELYGVEGGTNFVDLDSDKKPEIVVQFMSARGNESTWIFKWKGSSVQLINPTSPDGLSALGSVSFLDLKGCSHTATRSHT